MFLIVDYHIKHLSSLAFRLGLECCTCLSPLTMYLSFSNIQQKMHLVWSWEPHLWGNTEVHYFLEGISLKVKVIARPEFKLTHYDITVFYDSHYTTKTSSSLNRVWKIRMAIFILMLSIYVNRYVNRDIFKISLRKMRRLGSCHSFSLLKEKANLRGHKKSHSHFMTDSVSFKHARIVFK